MGVYTFKWDQPATDVYVTGTFDNWGKTEKLEKVGDVFQKEVTLPESSEKIFYKFVVDGNWTTNDSAPKETDSEGNLNNVLLPTDIKSKPEAAIMSSVGPEATTAGLAGKVPHESDVPGAFPETPTPALENKQFSVNPLPGTPGYGNAVNLAPGEPVPRSEEVTTNTIQSNVTLDKEAYEKPDAFPGGNLVSNGTAHATDLPDVGSKNLIPESSLPMGEAGAGGYNASDLVQSAGVGSTTAALAGQVPLEPKHEAVAVPKEPAAAVPEVVKESQELAGAAPEASGVSSEVADKSKLEDELLAKVPEAPVTSESTTGLAAASVPAVVKESQHLAGVAPEASGATTEIAEKSQVEDELLAKVPEAPATSDATTLSQASEPKTTTTVTSLTPPHPDEFSSGAAAAVLVPSVVQESQQRAGVSPEASGVPEEVYDKLAVEDELKQKVPEAPVTSEGTSSDAAAIYSNGNAGGAVASSAPEVVKESIESSGQSPEAATNSEAIAEKQATEKELLSAVKPATSTGEPAPKLDAPNTTTDSRDVSPHTIPSNSKAADATEQKKSEPAAPASAAAGSSVPPSPAKTETDSKTDKKKKRTSFFGKLKAKFSDHKH